MFDASDFVIETCACETSEDGWRPCPLSLCERPDHDHPLSLTQKLAAVREWVDTGIAATLDEDASGFLLGIASVEVLGVLDEVAAALNDLES